MKIVVTGTWLAQSGDEVTRGEVPIHEPSPVWPSSSAATRETAASASSATADRGPLNNRWR